MKSQTQRLYNKTRLTFTNNEGKIMVIYEFDRKNSFQRRFFKLGHESLTCKVTHGFWADDNSWHDSKLGRI